MYAAKPNTFKLVRVDPLLRGVGSILFGFNVCRLTANYRETPGLDVVVA